MKTTIISKFQANLLATMFTVCVACQVPVYSPTAQEFLKASNVKGGLIVVIGTADRTLLSDFTKASPYLIHGLDTNISNLNRAKEEKMHERLMVDSYDGTHLPYAEHFVNLMIVNTLDNISFKEIDRVLVPRGVVIINEAGKKDFLSRIPYPTSRIGNGFVKITKPATPELGEWTHWRHGPDGNMVANDKTIEMPRSLKWVASPKWQKNHELIPSTSAVVSSGGRLFVINDESPAGTGPEIPDKWVLTARDAFNGVLLWKRKIPLWGYKAWRPKQWYGKRGFVQPDDLARNFVAHDDVVYITLGYDAPVSALNGATGEIIREYKESEGTRESILSDGVLYFAISADMQETFSIRAVEAKSGKLLWNKDGFGRGKGKINLTLVDKEQSVIAMAGTDQIVSLDCATGTQNWKKTIAGCIWSSATSLLTHDDVIYIGDLHQKAKGTWDSTVTMRLVAVAAKDGSSIWDYPCGTWGNTTQAEQFVVDNLIWVHIDPEDGNGFAGLDLRTGEVVTKHMLAPTKGHKYHHHRCYPNRSTEKYLLTARRGVEFIDVKSGSIRVNHWLRGACSFGTLPANGLLYSTPHPCDCYMSIMMNNYCAYSSTMPKAGIGQKLEKGPGFGIAAKESSSALPEDWPTYRQNATRNGSSSCKISRNLKLKWRAKTIGKPTALTSAAGMVFFAGDNRRHLYALDCITGAELWKVHLGEMDTPPTYYKGLLLCGLRSGHVVCLNAQTGEIVWRFHAAPADKKIIAFNKLESAWPVHGSILVQNDKAFVCAGRSSMIDGGIYVYALEPQTGRVLASNRLSSIDEKSGEMLWGKILWGREQTDNLGALTDILVGDGKRVFMRHTVLKEDCQEERNGLEMLTYPHLRSNAGLMDETHYNRTSWNIDSQFYATFGEQAYRQGQMLVYDKNTVFGIRSVYMRKWWSEKGIFHPGTTGYTLFADNLQGEVNRWSVKLPLRANAMAITRDIYFVAGAPDRVSQDDPFAAFEGRGDGKLCLISPQDGTVLNGYKLTAQPVFDGMAIALGNIYLSLQNGEVVCFEEMKAGDTGQ